MPDSRCSRSILAFLIVDSRTSTVVDGGALAMASNAATASTTCALNNPVLPSCGCSGSASTPDDSS